MASRSSTSKTPSNSSSDSSVEESLDDDPEDDDEPEDDESSLDEPERVDDVDVSKDLLEEDALPLSVEDFAGVPSEFDDLVVADVPELEPFSSPESELSEEADESGLSWGMVHISELKQLETSEFPEMLC